VIRRNRGPIGDDGSPEGFVVIEVNQKGLRVQQSPTAWLNKLENQAVLLDTLGDAKRWERATDPSEAPAEPETVRLMSRKRTDAIYVLMQSAPRGLAFDRVGSREPFATSVRAAAISATQLILQRAALELDLGPEEFEALEPRLRNGLPLLQLADFLINGAGFSRRLASSESGKPLIARLIESLVNDPTDRLVSSYFKESHSEECARSCYRCLQRYNNRGFHGLLDWRLGIGFLRAMLDATWQAGLDGRWSAYRELADWPRLAREAAEELRRLDPDRRRVELLGPLELPVLFIKPRTGALDVEPQ